MIEKSTSFFEKNGGNRLPGIQALRAIAFTMIFLSHTGLPAFSHAGEFGVCVFIVMSGFLMTYNYYPKQDIKISPIVFSVKKLRRLYPLHIIMLLLGILVCKESKKFIAAILLPHVFLVQILIPNENYFSTLNGVSWYLSLCLFLYMAFPLILKFIRKFEKKHYLLLFTIFLLLLQLVFTLFVLEFVSYDNEWFSHKWILYYNPFARLIDFSIGCNVGYFYIHKNNFIKESRYILNTFAEVFVFTLWIVFSSYVPKWGLHWAVVPIIPSCIIVVLFAENNDAVANILSNKLIIKIGDISPYAFLIHPLVIRIINYIDIGGMLSVSRLNIIIAYAVTITASVIYEKISNRLKIRLKGRNS